jgi:hypothetical protein
MDTSSQEKLISANVLSKDYKIGTNSNLCGFYSLTVPQRQKLLFTFSYVGYTAKDFEFSAENNLTLDVL